MAFTQEYSIRNIFGDMDPDRETIANFELYFDSLIDYPILLKRFFGEGARKHCTRCKNYLLLEEFVGDGKRKNRIYCKFCCNQISNNYYHNKLKTDPTYKIKMQIKEKKRIRNRNSQSRTLTRPSLVISAV